MQVGHWYLPRSPHQWRSLGRPPQPRRDGGPGRGGEVLLAEGRKIFHYNIMETENISGLPLPAGSVPGGPAGRLPGVPPLLGRAGLVRTPAGSLQGRDSQAWLNITESCCAWQPPIFMP